MALTSTIEYCTNRDIKDIYPHIDEFDTKVPVYGWVKHMDDYSGTSGVDLWYAYNTGLVTELFVNGNKTTKITFPTSATTLLNGAISAGIVGATVDSETGFAEHDIVKIDNQYMLLSAVTTNTLAWTGDGTMFNTQSVGHADDSSVYLVRDDSEYDVPDYYTWFYDPDLDLCVITIKGNEDPNDMLMESGEDWVTLKTRYRRNASRLFESRVDSSISREMWKDREGNYDYIVVRTTAMLAVIMLIKANQPTSEFADALMLEVNQNIELINKGEVKMSNQISKDSSQGVLREVSVNSASDLRIVDTRGAYNGIYDNLQIKVDSGAGGVIGTSTFTVKGKNSSGLKVNTLISSKTITGDYQSIGNGLQIRWGGDDVATAITTQNDEYELEVFGRMEMVDNSVIGGITNTRR